MDASAMPLERKLKDQSYYSAFSNPAPSYESLTGSIEADVCVVGGGIAGCSTALHLAERGYRVVLLEGERIGWGASGRNGGQVLVGYPRGRSEIEAAVGRDGARTLWGITVESIDLLRDLVARHGIDCDLHWGALHAAIKERQRRDLFDELKDAQDYGYDKMSFLERPAIEALLETQRYRAGLLDAGSGHLHPLNYTLGLARAAVDAGVRIFEQSHVLAVKDGDTAVVRTQHGEVRAKFVALCCNAYIDKLNAHLRARIMPVGTYIVATEPLGEARATALIRKNIAVADTNFVLDYFRRSADHRLLFGGRVSYSGFDAFDTARATRKRMVKVFPQLGDVRIEFTWGGFVDITWNRLPDFGRLAPNVYYLQGFSGHGIALTGIAGKLVAEAIAGHAERFDVFTRIKHSNFPGGPLRMPLLVVLMSLARLRDLL